jgi:hypothetical protein
MLRGSHQPMPNPFTAEIPQTVLPQWIVQVTVEANRTKKEGKK